MVIIWSVDVEVQIETLTQTFALLWRLALQVMGEFASLLYERGDLLLQSFDHLVLGVENLHQSLKLWVLSQFFLNLQDFIPSHIVLDELLFVDLCHFLANEFILYCSLSIG